MRLMFDACDAQNIPTNAAIVGGYTDGLCKWSDADWARFPDAIKVPISSLGTDSGVVLDVEPGNPNALRSVDWVRKRRAAGVDPTLYVAQWAPGYTWQDCLNAFARAGEDPPHFWVAPIQSGLIPEGAVAVQYGYIGPFDLSHVTDYWPGVDPLPQVSKTLEVEMFVRRTSDGFVMLLYNGQLVPLHNVNDYAAGSTAGMKTWEVSDEFFAALGKAFPQAASL